MIFDIESVILISKEGTSWNGKVLKNVAYNAATKKMNRIFCTCLQFV